MSHSTQLACCRLWDLPRTLSGARAVPTCCRRCAHAVRLCFARIPKARIYNARGSICMANRLGLVSRKQTSVACAPGACMGRLSSRLRSRLAGATLTGFQTGSGQTGFLQKCRNIP